MKQTDLFTQTPKSFEGFIDAFEGIDCEEAVKKKALEDLKERYLHHCIRNEYRVAKQGNWGESEQIKSELAGKYFNNPDRIDLINKILYHKYR